MVTFGDIETLRVKYTEEVEGYKVAGTVTYNGQKKITEANGHITDAGDKHVANFNAYGEGEYARINLTDCVADKMSTAADVANATLANLAAQYPEE